ETVGPAIVKGVGQVPPNTIVVASPLTSDQTAPKGDELAARIAAVIAGKLGGTVRAHGQAAQLATARAISSKGGGLLYVTVEIANGELRVTADLYPVMRNGWDRVRIPVPPPRAHAFASAPVDPEIRAFLPPILLEQAAIKRVRHDEGEVLAAACGDADGDGGMELVLVSRGRVALGKIAGDRFVPRRTAPWAALSARAPVSMREPLAGAAFVPP